MELNGATDCGQLPECTEGPSNKRKRRYSQCSDSASGQSHFKCISDVNATVNTTEYDGAPAAKYREVETNAVFQLTDLPDEVLYEIFKNLDSLTQYALMKCCSRFRTLLLDHRFWKHIDLSKQSLPMVIIKQVLERAHANTSSIKVQGKRQAPGGVDHFNNILGKTLTYICTQLTVLELWCITIDSCCMHVSDFPVTLKRLVFNNCFVREQRLPRGEPSIFSGIHTRLTQLEELGIENNDWFEPSYIIVLSGIPSLRWFSLKGCPRLGDFIPYASMAARFGFKKLEYLDLRFTPINNSDLQCFNAVFTLKEILLDCPEDLRDPEFTFHGKNGTSYDIEDAISDDSQPSTSRAAAHLMPINFRTNGSADNEAASSSSSSSSSSPRISSPASSPVSPPVFESEQIAAAEVRNQSMRLNFVPSRSRFLPRPDQVILLDVLNQRPGARTLRQPRLDSHFDHMLQHINPFGNREGDAPMGISDRGICCFGRPQNPVEQGFERLSVRNYKKVTDVSLQHLVQCSPHLVFLDLSGTSVTRAGVRSFKGQKPECHIVADHLNSLDEDDADLEASN